MSNLTLSSPRLSWRGWYCHVVNGSTVWGTRCGFTRTQAVVRAARLLVRLTAAGADTTTDQEQQR